MSAQVGCWLFFRGGRCKYIASLCPRPSVHDAEPHPMGDDPVYAEHSRSKGVNLDKQSPILRCERLAYRMNGRMAVGESVKKSALWNTS